MTTTSKAPRGTAGFSLIEMAVVLVIVGVAAGYGLSIANALRAREGYSTTKMRMDVIHERLVAYVAANGRLPCPARPLSASSPEAGKGQCPGSSSIAPGPAPSGRTSVLFGPLPYRDLGLAPEDALDGWNTQIDFAVNVNATAGGYITPSAPLDARLCIQPIVPTATHTASYQDEAGESPLGLCSNLAGSWPEHLLHQPGETKEEPCVIKVTGITLGRFLKNKSLQILNETGTAVQTPAAAYALVSHGENRGGGFSVDGDRQGFASSESPVDTANTAPDDGWLGAALRMPTPGSAADDRVRFFDLGGLVAAAKLSPEPLMRVVVNQCQTP